MNEFSFKNRKLCLDILVARNRQSGNLEIRVPYRRTGAGISYGIFTVRMYSGSNIDKEGKRLHLEEENILQEVDSERVRGILEEFYHQIIYKEEAELIVFITKKAYWSFWVLKNNLPERENTGNVQWLSDRFFMKILDFSEYNGMNIVIVDDTMNSGMAIRKFYHMMRKQCPDSNIVPIVCLLNEQYNPEEYNSDNIDKDFHEKLEVYYKAKPTAIGQMCVYETLTFHDKLISYVVDLPVLEQIDEMGEWTSKIRMSKEKFNELCLGNQYWTYTDCEYDVIPERKSQFGFFRFYSAFLHMKFDSLLMNTVVKVQYLVEEDTGMVEVVFTPFAIMRSGKAEELKQCFQLLFENTTYCKELKIPSDENLLENYYTAVYRSIVYCISMYIGVKFINYMKSDKEMRLNNEMQFVESFYESINRIFPRENNYEKFDELKFVAKVLRLKPFSKVSLEEQRNFNGGEMKFANYQNCDWFAFLYEKIISTKRHDNEKRFFISEDFERMLENRLDVDSEEENRSLLTQILLEALNKSVLTNYLYYDGRTKTIFRGYRYGENTELLLPYDARIFYCGILHYYKKVGKAHYFDRLDYFLMNFKAFLERQGLYDYLITDRQFQFFSRYFSDLAEKDIETQIENKRYLLMDDFCKSSELFNQSLKKIEEFVQRMNLRKEEEN